MRVKEGGRGATQKEENVDARGFFFLFYLFVLACCFLEKGRKCPRRLDDVREVRHRRTVPTFNQARDAGLQPLGGVCNGKLPSLRQFQALFFFLYVNPIVSHPGCPPPPRPRARTQSHGSGM